MVGKWGTRTMILKRKNKKDKIFSEYPCSVYLHNALRFITNNEPEVAYEDICHALMKAGDELSDEEKRERLRMIEKDIELILNKYLTDDEWYMPYRYETDEEGKEQEILFETELREYCEKYDVNYKYVVQEAFDSCGYSCDVGVIAFIDENSELQIMTVLYERY